MTDDPTSPPILTILTLAEIFRALEHTGDTYAVIKLLFSHTKIYMHEI